MRPVGGLAHNAQRNHHDNEEGFTVIEFTVAMALLVVCLIAGAQMMTSGMRVSGDTRARVIAANLATQTLEDLRAQAADITSFPTIAVGRTTLTPQTVSGTTFTVTRDVAWVGHRGTGSNCDAGGSGTLVLRASAVVTWGHMNGTAPVQSTTTFSPPVGAYSANSGSVAAKVLGVTGQPISGVTVTATGTTSGTSAARSVSTDADGCAFFAQLGPGTYDVTAASAGYVDDQQRTTALQTASVVASQTVAVTFAYDRAAQLTSAFGGFTPAGGNIGVSITNTGLQPNGVFNFLTPLAGTSVYPYPTGYGLFAGTCSDSNPLGTTSSGAAYYPSEVPGTPITTSPGGTATGQAHLYQFAVRAMRNGSPVASATVTLTPHTSGTGVTCATGTTAITLPNTSATTASPAGYSTAGVPLGHYTVTVRSGSRSGTATIWVKPKTDGSGLSEVWRTNSSGVAQSLVTLPLDVTLS